MGMSEKDFSELLGALKSSAKVSKGETKIAWEKFAKDYPALNSKMHVMVHRESRRVIQENDLGAMIPVMGKGWAQTMFQFQNFTFQAWNKAMLFGLNHRDTSTLLTVMYSSLIASGAYTARMSLNSLGMSDLERDVYLEKRLNPQQIVANSFGRINQASLLPQLIDTLSPQPIFSGLRTTSDIASLASNPTLGLLDTLVNTKKLIRNSYSDEYQTSQRDVRSMLKLVPLNNVVPISSVINAVAEEYPRSETQ